MLKKPVLAALNKQIQQELSNSYAYLGLALWFDQQVYKGFAKFFMKQSEEEREHAMRILNFVQDANEQVTLGAIEAPKTEYPSVLEAVKAAREWERKNSEAINGIYALALKENDLATQNHLQWFISEQVEEEKWAEELVTLVEKVGTHTGALYMLDHHTGKRVDKDA